MNALDKFEDFGYQKRVDVSWTGPGQQGNLVLGLAPFFGTWQFASSTPGVAMF